MSRTNSQHTVDYIRKDTGKMKHAARNLRLVPASPPFRLVRENPRWRFLEPVVAVGGCLLLAALSWFLYGTNRHAETWGPSIEAERVK